MNRFAELLDRLAYEPGRNNKLRLITAYFKEVGDPDRGYALAALTGAREIWVTHGQEDALVHWCKTKGLAARPLDLVGYGDEEESEIPLAGEDEA